MKTESIQLVVNGKRRRIALSPLTVQFIPNNELYARGLIQNAIRISVSEFWDIKHSGEYVQPNDCDETVKMLCEIYQVGIPELLRTCVAWYDGYKENKPKWENI